VALGSRKNEAMVDKSEFSRRRMPGIKLPWGIKRDFYSLTALSKD